LKQWCGDTTAMSNVRCDYVFVDQVSFEKYHPKTFGELMASFQKFK
jgi:hypothetical protein